MSQPTEDSSTQGEAWQPYPPKTAADPVEGEGSTSQRTADSPAEDDTWQSYSPAAPDQAVEPDRPQAVRDEERFLDAVASRGDDLDASQMDVLRDVVSQWYDDADRGR